LPSLGAEHTSDSREIAVRYYFFPHSPAVSTCGCSDHVIKKPVGITWGHWPRRCFSAHVHQLCFHMVVTHSCILVHVGVFFTVGAWYRLPSRNWSVCTLNFEIVQPFQTWIVCLCSPLEPAGVLWSPCLVHVMLCSIIEAGSPQMNDSPPSWCGIVIVRIRSWTINVALSML
jgi:hypothetical protein